MNLADLIKPEKPNPEYVPARKAILWGGDDLFSQAVGLFLETRTIWDVVQISSKSRVSVLVETARRIRPEMIILCSDDKSGETTLPMRLIEEIPCLKVITIGLESNLIQVYSRQQVMIEGVSDLLSILETGNFSNYALGKEAEPAQRPS